MATFLNYTKFVARRCGQKKCFLHISQGNGLIASGRSYSIKSSAQNLMKVTLIGAAGKGGQSLALMLKQCSLIDELCLYDIEPTEGVASELQYVDTKCRVSSKCGRENIQEALRAAKIIIIMAAKPRSGYMAFDSMFEYNAPIVQEVIMDISKHNPKALIALCTNPVNSLVPMVSAIMKKRGYYNPKTIFGVTTLDSVRANTLVAETMGIAPECVTVPVVGGNTATTIVPLLSQAKPCAELTNDELEEITRSIKKGHEIVVKVKRNSGPRLSGAFAIARFVVSLVKALQGVKNVIECAYVKSEDNRIKYLASPLLLGPSGMVKNFGLPDMTDYEKCLLQNAIDALREDIKQGEMFVGVRDPPKCDDCDPNPKAPRCPPDTCELQARLVTN